MTTLTAPESTIRELILENDVSEPCIHLTFDIETGEIHRLENWHGCEVSVRWERVADERIYAERLRYLERKGMTTSDAQALLDAEVVA